MKRKRDKTPNTIHRIVSRYVHHGEEVIDCSCGTRCRPWMGGPADETWEMHANPKVGT